MHDAFKSSRDHLHYFETAYLLNAFKPHERVETLLQSLGNGAGLPALFEPSARTRASGLCGLQLLEVKDLKHLSIKPELAGSFNVRLDLRGVMGVWGHCVGDAVPMRSHPPDAIHHNSSSPS